MKQLAQNRPDRAVTLLELLCVFAIITVLASMLLGPASRVLQRVRADKWGDEASALLESTVGRLNERFRGQEQFPPVTLAIIERDGLVRPAELRFLKDRRVTFVTFAGADPDDKIVIHVQLERGFLYGRGVLTGSKGAITRVPD